MKKLIVELIVVLLVMTALLFANCKAYGQTTNQVPNYIPPADWYQMALTQLSTSTNFAVIGGYGHTIKGTGKNLVFGEVGYNFNNYVGVVGGYDYLWGAGKHQFNSLQGGLSLQAPFHPFGLTSLVVAPTVFDQIATSSSSSVANVMGAGLDTKWLIGPQLYFHAGIDYEKRTSDSVWAGEYGLVHLALSGNF